MRLALSSATVSIAFVVCFSACKKEDPAAQPAQYPQGQQPTYGQPAAQPAYGQPAAQPTYGQPAAQPAAPVAPAAAPAAPAAATGMNPSPQGLACTTDAQCLTHKCNTQLGKCSYPCQTAADCLAGFQCMTPICVPSAASLPAAPAAK
jgi:hypothetical protein